MPSAPRTTAGCPSPQLGLACPWLIMSLAHLAGDRGAEEGLGAHNTCPASKRKTPSTVKQLSWHKGGRVIMFSFPPSQYDQCRVKEGLGTVGWRWQGWYGGPGTGRCGGTPSPFPCYLVTPRSPPQERSP